MYIHVFIPVEDESHVHNIMADIQCDAVDPCSNGLNLQGVAISTSVTHTVISGFSSALFHVRLF